MRRGAARSRRRRPIGAINRGRFHVKQSFFLLVVPLCLSGLTLGSEYPNKPIRFIVAGPAGGASDIPARIVAQKLGESLRQQIVVDNRPGAAGRIGTELAARTAPDGYTILLISTAYAINPSLYRHLPYDPVKDFTPVASLINVCNVLVAHPSVPAKSVKDLIRLAKSRPGALNFASGGTGTGIHLSGELFKTMSGIDIVHVPYKGTTPALVDVMSGQVPMMFVNLPPAMPLIKSGKVRVLAVTCVKRSPFLPDVPTVSESGLPGYEADGWFGVVTSVDTSTAITRRLNQETNRILNMADVKEQLRKTGAEPFVTTPEEFGTYIKSQITKWLAVVRASGARAD